MRKFLIYALLSLLVGCPGLVNGDPLPTDRYYYPSALLKKDNTLYVINTNLNLRYQTGSLMQVDADSGKLLDSSLIPSSAGQFVATPDFKTLLVTTQQIGSLNSIRQGKSFPLGQLGPYYLSLIPGEQAGLLGYLVNPTSDLLAPDRFSLVRDLGELQYFEYDSEFSVQIKQNLKMSDCLPVLSQPYRRVSRLGSVLIVNQNVYVLAELIVSPDYRPEKHVFMFKVSLSNVRSGNWNPQTCQATDLTAGTTLLQARAGRAMVVSSDEKTAYLLLDENPVLVRVTLGDKVIVSQSESTCKSPSQMRLSPNGNSLLIACAKTNQVLAYNTSNLSLFGEYLGGTTLERKGMGPADILFDLDPSFPERVFVSFEDSHQIGIFKHANSTTTTDRSFDFVRWLELSR